MNVCFRIPRILQEYCAGEAEFQVTGHSVVEVLADVRQKYPLLYTNICDETGKVRRHIHVFVNDDLVTGQEVHDRAIGAGDVISVFQAVSGG